MNHLLDDDNCSISSIDETEQIELFTKEDEGHLIENALNLIEIYTNANLLIYNNTNYKEIITNDIIDIFEIQLCQLYEINNDTKENFREELSIIIHHAFKIFHKLVMPIRSFKRTFIRKLPNVKLISNTINYLKNKPQPEQKTEEWYKFRNNTLTASNIWKAFGTPSMVNQLIYEKCNPTNLSKLSKLSTSIDNPMHWGNKYEPLSVMVYENKYKTKIGEFGCILHDKYDFIAASPDGINIESSSKRYGRMLEIKNIVNREINGIPKLEYWIQMQIQMEVCNLNECDFLETRFVEYESKEDFDNDGTFNYTNNNKSKGIIMMFNKDDIPKYIYPPLNLSEEESEKWEEETMEKYNDLVWVKNIYWKLETISCVLVLRNKEWFRQAVPVLTELWNTIKREKIEGYSHRAPKRKTTLSKKNINDEEIIIKKCFIDVNILK
jgi:putative phage-type endonuclease